MNEHAKRLHPKRIGDRSQAMILGRLSQMYDSIFLPFGENLRYDLLIDDHEAGLFIRVQCKTGQLKRGTVIFNACSSTYHHPNRPPYRNGHRSYRGEADIFGVYCTDTDDVYLVPVNDVGMRQATLRVEAPRNGQSRSIRWAQPYDVRNLSPAAIRSWLRRAMMDFRLCEQAAMYAV